MTTEKQTPTPWKTLIVQGRPPKIVTEKPQQGFIAQLGFPNEGNREANAAFIVLAVNSHDALVDALEAERRKVADLTKLLKPFAAEADEWLDTVPDDYRPMTTEPGQDQAFYGSDAKYTLGDLRAARAALAGKEKP